jgi:polygalacturonase
MFTRREILKLSAKLVGVAALAGLTETRVRAQSNRRPVRIFDVRDFGARGDGTTLDTAAIQRTIDEASAAEGDVQVLLRGGRRYLVGALQLKGRIDFHLADDAELLVSPQREHYPGGMAVISAEGLDGLRLSGTGSINGRSPEFMTAYDAENEWWRPASFRPRLVVLTGCKNLEVRDLTLRQAPSWTLHLLGCEKVLVDNVKIRNQLDVPNCDGIDPDHCREVEIRNCNIACGDDGIVIKTTRQGARFGPSSNLVVKDCVFETQDSGVKIGTETTQDISNVRFERCEIKGGCRGLCIQLRDEGSISGVVFRDITFVSRYFSAPWWGRGEAISFTAIPRSPTTRVGVLRDVRIENVTGRAENSVRISGSAQSRVSQIHLEKVAITLERWTKYHGGEWDNRPTTAGPEIEPHGTPGFSIRHADDVVLKDCSVTWGQAPPDYFTHALEAEDVTRLEYPGFKGKAAHPERDQAIVIKPPAAPAE